MSTKTPLVVNDTTGIPQAITAPDTIDPAFLPAASSSIPAGRVFYLGGG